MVGEMKHVAHNSVKVTHGCIKIEKFHESLLWHLRLGHAPMMKLYHLGISNKPSKEVDHLCVTCPMGKLTKQPYALSHSRATQAFELLHIHIWGPYKVQTREGFRIFLTIIDDHSRTTWVTLLKQKSNSFIALQRFITLAGTPFGKKVKIVRSDNALEFKDTQCRTLYDSHGIIHQTTCVDKAQQNERCERKH